MFHGLLDINAKLHSMKWLEAFWIIAFDVLERLHRLHIWFLFGFLGMLVGAMIGVLVFNRTQSMMLGAFLGLLAGLRLARWHLKK